MGAEGTVLGSRGGPGWEGWGAVALSVPFPEHLRYARLF